MVLNAVCPTPSITIIQVTGLNMDYMYIHVVKWKVGPKFPRLYTVLFTGRYFRITIDKQAM